MQLFPIFFFRLRAFKAGVGSMAWGPDEACHPFSLIEFCRNTVTHLVYVLSTDAFTLNDRTESFKRPRGLQSRKIFTIWSFRESSPTPTLHI